MADQLTSVRFSADTISALKGLAELHDGSVAAEIREAVEAHIRLCTSAPGFREEVARKQQERRASTEDFAARLLSLGSS